MFKNLQIKSLLLLLVGMGGSVSGWAEETGTITFGNNGVKINAASVTGEDDLDETWTITTVGTTSFTSNSAYYQVGSSKAPATSITFTTTLSEEVNITAFSAVFGGFSGTEGSVVLKVDNEEVGTGNLNGTSDVTVSNTKSALGKTLTVTVTDIAKGVKCYQISYTYEESSVNPAQSTTTTIDATGITNTDVYAGTAAGTLSATVHAGNELISGAEVAWESSNVGVATVNANGVVTLVAAGTTTITATYAGVEGTYRASSDTYELTVTNTDPNVPGTEDNPYTVEEARAAIDSNVGITGVYAKGVVSGIVTAYNSQYGNITYNISDDGDVDSPQLEIYRGKSYNGDNFTSDDDIQVGDTVIVKGNLQLYRQTYEFASNSQLVYLGRPAAAEVAKITVTEPLIELDANEHSGNIAVQYENVVMDSEIIEVQFVDADGEPAAYDWIVAELDPNYGIEYIVVSNNGEARTAYLQVYGLDANAEAVYSNIITITQAKPVVDYATLPFTFDGKLSDIAETAGLTQSGLGSDYKAAPYLKFDTTGDCLVLKLNEAPEVISFDVKGNGFSGGTFTVQTSVDGESYTDLASFTDLADTETKTLINNNANVRFIKWIYTEKVSGNVGFGNISVKKLSVTVSAAGWATYVAEANVAFPQGVSAYIVSGTTDTTVELEEVLAVVEGTPVVLNAEAGTYNLEVVAAALCDDVANNRLEVSDETTGNGVYVLANHNSVPGFYKWAGGLLGAGRVYLPAEAAPDGARSFLGFGNGTSTGIEAVENVETSGSMFDLQGRRVMQPTKGLYIVGGKKVVLK